MKQSVHLLFLLLLVLNSQSKGKFISPKTSSDKNFVFCSTRNRAHCFTQTSLFHEEETFAAQSISRSEKLHEQLISFFFFLRNKLFLEEPTANVFRLAAFPLQNLFSLIHLSGIRISALGLIAVQLKSSITHVDGKLTHNQQRAS